MRTVCPVPQYHPTDELQFTTENSEGITQRALPSLIGVLARSGRIHLGDVNYAQMVHGSRPSSCISRCPSPGPCRRCRGSPMCSTADRAQALLYRLTGDRNPLHVDPKYAAKGGFDTPILHGMCTYGFTGRALLNTIAGGDPDLFRSMAGRFSRPVWPGDTLTISIWTDGPNARFQTKRQDGTVVIDRGTASIRS